MQISQDFVRAAGDWIRRRVFEDQFFDYGEGSVQRVAQRIDFFLQRARVQQHLRRMKFQQKDHNFNGILSKNK